MNKRIWLLIGLVSCLALPLGLTLGLTGCGTSDNSASAVPPLEPGGVYSDPYLAKTDEAIVAADQALVGFVNWYNANATFLAKYPELGQLAAKVDAHRVEWVKDAWDARDAYANAANDYKQGKATSPSTAAVDAALSIINSVTTEITTLKAAHPNE